MGAVQSKKIGKSIQIQSILIDLNKEIAKDLKIITQWSLQQIKQMCLTYSRYSADCPYVSRFIFKKLLSFSHQNINQKIFQIFSKGQSILYLIIFDKSLFHFISFYVLLYQQAIIHTKENFNVIILLLTNLLVLYLIFNFTHDKNIKLKHFLLIFQTMLFGYCRITDQPLPPYSQVKKYLFQQFINSQTNQVLQKNFQFRKLILQVDINSQIFNLFQRFQGNIYNAKDKPQVFMLNTQKKYDKEEQAKIFRIIKKVYENHNYDQIQLHQKNKTFRLQNRKYFCLQNIQNQRTQKLSGTNNFRIKNKIYSLTNLRSNGSNSKGKIQYQGKFSLSEHKAIKNNPSLLKTLRSNSQNKIKNIPQINYGQMKNKIKELKNNNLQNVQLSSILNKKSPVVFLGGKAQTKYSFFNTIQYFNSLSNNKQQIKLKQFVKIFQKRNFIKKQTSSFFNYFDKKQKGVIKFQQFLKAIYPQINEKQIDRLRQWRSHHQIIYQIDKISDLKNQQKANIQLPYQTHIRINQIFRSFNGGKKIYIEFQDLRSAYNGFSLHQLQNLIKEFGDKQGKIYIQQFTKMILPQGYVIEKFIM